jgi:hypothetical protein
MRFFATFAFTTLLLTGVAGTRADEETGKAPKADVTIKDKAKTGSAKVGQLVEFQVQYPVVPPFPTDFKLTVNGKEMKHEARTTPVLRDGRPVVGVQNKSLYARFEEAGMKKVVIEWKKGDDTSKREVELDVK